MVLRLYFDILLFTNRHGNRQCIPKIEQASQRLMATDDGMLFSILSVFDFRSLLFE